MKLVKAAKSWLVFASLFFYSFWNPVYLPLILVSILVNFKVGKSLSSNKKEGLSNKRLLIIGILFNTSLLIYFKYTDFFIHSVNVLFKSSFALQNILLPLAISFFTFQQIAYLVDSYKNETKEHDFLNYILFVTFFPQLIAGPIVHHKEMMPQFFSLKSKFLNWENIFKGMIIFFIGLSKKVIIADSLSPYVASGFSYPLPLPFFEAWSVTLAYCLQIYYDFSGYTDMAIGSALLFNINLPLNFNSPYKALNIQEFWRCWHMTLSRWLRDYIYIPLGGNRLTKLITYRNLFLTFLIGGFWHGAGWTYIIWGAMHGGACCIHKFWQKMEVSLPKLFSWGLTFIFINFTWIFFRAPDLNTAWSIFKGTIGLNGFTLPAQLSSIKVLESMGVIFETNWLQELNGSTVVILSFIFVTLLFSLFMKNSNELRVYIKPNFAVLSLTAIIAVYSLLSLSKVSEFLYFQF